MLGQVDPKTLTDEQLSDKIHKCREYISYSYTGRSNSMLLPSLQQLLFILEEEMNYRNQKKFLNTEIEEKMKSRETQYPINLGTIEGEEQNGKKGSK